ANASSMEIRSTRGEITDDLDGAIAQPFVFLEMAADKGPPAEIAKTIRRRVRGELGLPISVGVAHTKHLAKIASQVAKPDGLVVPVRAPGTPGMRRIVGIRDGRNRG